MKKWVVRGLVFCSLGGMALVGLLYQYWTNPEAVRRQVLAHVQGGLRNVQVSLESARLRLFGGIEIRELRISRKDDLDKTDFLYIPSGTIYYDKEQVLEGGVRIRKVDIRRVRLRVVREHDGAWNLAGLTGPSDLNRRAPTVIVSQGSLLIEDRQTSGALPLEIHDVSLTMINDPLPILTFEGSGICEGAGPVKIRGRVTRGGGPLSLTVEAPSLTVGPELVQRLAGYRPDAAIHLRRLSARGKISARINWDPRATPALNYSIKGELSEGEFGHALLPWALEKLRGSFQCTNGMIPEARLEASAGATHVSVALKDVRLDGGPSVSLADRIGSMELRAEHFQVSPELFKYLPAGLQSYQTDYSPTGPASVRLNLRRIGPGLWKQDGVFTAEGLEGNYLYFRYPLSKVQGTIDWQQTTDTTQGKDAPGRPDDRMGFNLKGEAAGKPIFLQGQVEGGRGTNAIQLDFWGNDVPLDERLLAALPQRSQVTARAFHPAGRLDFRVLLRRARGQTELSKRFLVHLHECTVRYDLFPLPLNNVSGTLDLRPNSWQFRDFLGHYNGGTLHASGGSQLMSTSGPIARNEDEKLRTRVTTPYLTQPVSYTTENVAAAGEESEAASGPSRVSVLIEGKDLPVDDLFKQALAPGREELARAFNTFALTGRLTFTARIDDLPNQPRDVDVTVHVGGCRIAPAFFPYPLEDVAATVRYAKNNLWLTGFQGRHGKTILRINQCSVVLPREGGFWAKLDKLESPALIFDEEFQKALPPALARLARVLRTDQPATLATVLVMNQPPAAGAKPTVYWKADLGLRDTTIKGGIEWSHVTGVLSCEGRHNGSQVEDVVGNVFLQEATVLRQPLRNVHLPLLIWKETPDILRLPDMKAELFGGTIDGEARIEFGSIFRYELLLNASRIQLEQLGSHNFGRNAELSGLANAGIHVSGEGPELEGMRGNGQLDVPSGKMYRLPLFLDLLKWLGLRLPDRTAFEQAHLEFALAGPKLEIPRLDLLGSAISVRGHGSMNLDGNDVRLELNADWGRLSGLLPAYINGLSHELSNQLLRVKVSGRVGELKFEKELVPIVTDPLKKLWHGLASQTGPKAQDR